MIRALLTRSTLPLFVFRILADDPYGAFALDDLAFVTHRLHGSSNLHLLLLSIAAQKYINVSSLCADYRVRPKSPRPLKCVVTV